MAKDNQPFEDLSETAAHAVEQNMEKARGAMDNYFSFLQNIWGRNDLTEKIKTYTEKNISAYELRYMFESALLYSRLVIVPVAIGRCPIAFCRGVTKSLIKG
jgi:hypothetical protein